MRVVADSGIAFQRHVIPMESCLVKACHQTPWCRRWYLISHTVAGLWGGSCLVCDSVQVHNFSSLGPLYNVKQFRQEAPRS